MRLILPLYQRQICKLFMHHRCIHLILSFEAIILVFISKLGAKEWLTLHNSAGTRIVSTLLHMAKRVAIIGAGVGGLTSIKNALDAGFKPTAYEKDSWFGGIWYYTQDEHRFAAPKSTIFNTSKHFCCFSDFPFPKETPNYTTSPVFHQYLESYAEKFDLTRRIRFNTEVLKVEKCKDYEKTGRWEIHSKTSDGSEKENVCIEEYDYVMVCSGAYAKPIVPKMAGINDFTGGMMHSKFYKTFVPFLGKRVLVVGLGNTGADIACELSRHASQVYLSIRHGTYVLPRLIGDEIPMDLSIYTRAGRLLPKVLQDLLLRRKLRSFYNLNDLGLDSMNGRTPIIINDDLPTRILTGTIIVKDEIACFKDKKVLFTDETELDDIDDVIFATGYDVHVPFLPKSIFDLDKASYCSQLYKLVFPVDIPHPTIAFIGFCPLRGSGIPLREMQARWAMHIFKGELHLPSKKVMEKEIEERQKGLFGNGNRRTVIAFRDGPSYADDIASLIGVKPKLWNLFFQDPKLAIKCFFGPAIPAQHRLMGPGAWSGAKDVIKEVEESRLAPLTTRKGNNQ